MVAGPVFSRVAQQVLGYMNVPHDVELQARRRMTLRAQAKNEDLTDAAPDYIADQTATASVAAPASAEPAGPQPADGSTKQAVAQATPVAKPSAPPQTAPVIMTAAVVPRGTLVVDVGGSVTVPDFRGKPLRTALEEAESAGLELEVSGSGVGKEQSPAAGAKVMPGGHVVVRFGR